MAESPSTGPYAGRYEIVALLGEGAQATVYRARDLELGEEVALKVLRRDVATTPAVLEHFRREARLARRITHRNVARVFDIGEYAGERFLTMEFVEGMPLSELVAQSKSRNTRLPIRQVADIAQQVCAGLAAAHAAGVIHRDLKPANILLSRDGRVVITDLGIARPLQPLAGAELTMGISGTAAYMAPEQLNTPHQIDARADLYALGVVLFELLTGTLPFLGENWIDVALMRFTTPPPDPRTLRSDLPQTAAALILRCMAVKPEDRYRSVEEVAAELSEWTRPVAAENALAGMGSHASSPKGFYGLPQETGSTRIVEVARMTGGTVAAPAAASRLKTLAVLPIVDDTPDADEYLADGLTEMLIDQLGAVRGLRVRSRGAVLALRGDRRDVRTLGQELGVQVVLSGQLHVSGARTELSLQLTTVDHGLQFFTRRVSQPIAGLLPACTELARAVAEVLTVDPQNIAPASGQSQVAELYLRARYLYQRSDRASVKQSVILFEEALHAVPDDPYVLTGYALACARLWFYGEAQAGEQARAAAARAVALAPTRGESYLALAIVHFHFGEAARAAYELRRALSYAPALPEAHELTGRLLVETGPIHEGIRYLESAIHQDPSLHRARLDLARAQGLVGAWDKVDDLLEQEMETATAAHKPESQLEGFPLLWIVWLCRARMVLWRKDRRRARQDLQHPIFASGGPPLARSYLELGIGGPPVEPSHLVNPALLTGHASSRSRSYVYQTYAELYSHYGAIDLALQALALSIADGLVDLMWMEHCPLLEPLRKDPRFAVLRTIAIHRVAAVHAALGWTAPLAPIMGGQATPLPNRTPAP